MNFLFWFRKAVPYMLQGHSHHFRYQGTLFVGGCSWVWSRQLWLRFRSRIPLHRKKPRDEALITHWQLEVRKSPGCRRKEKWTGDKLMNYFSYLLSDWGSLYPLFTGYWIIHRTDLRAFESIYNERLSVLQLWGACETMDFVKSLGFHLYLPFPWQLDFSVFLCS